MTDAAPEPTVRLSDDDVSRRGKKAAFIAAYSTTGIVTAAATAAGIHRATHYKWLDEDPEYSEEIDRAGETAVEYMEAEARRRAVLGVDEPVFQGGEQVGVKRKYSDVLLIFLLKAARPEVYRERLGVEHSGPEGGPIPIDRERAAAREILGRPEVLDDFEELLTRHRLTGFAEEVPGEAS